MIDTTHCRNLFYVRVIWTFTCPMNSICFYLRLRVSQSPLPSEFDFAYIPVFGAVWLFHTLNSKTEWYRHMLKKCYPIKFLENINSKVFCTCHTRHLIRFAHRIFHEISLSSSKPLFLCWTSGFVRNASMNILKFWTWTSTRRRIFMNSQINMLSKRLCSCFKHCLPCSYYHSQFFLFWIDAVL